ncbi:MAG: phytoene desaturase [Acidobacteria bacterium]|nr:MAG: phytoene desaturase [Acidobacteriota bacterium]REK02085.1 MAG: phytoene desaturase [Acidobacteriota bacterium]REK15043.1 MAG: phytoene desaturase [Acidobacteriota bacterium]REK45757.1 MAG: phytoene desaturase [Acidobacteriota bacterium]
MKILVIGSGFGGLSAAIRLQAQGHSVTIVEKLDKIGGRAYVFEQDGFKFDAGPTIITAPWLIDELFELGGKQTSDYVELRKLDPFYNIRWEDGSVFHYNDDKERLRSEILKFDPDGLPGYERFAKELEDIYKVGFDLIDQPFLSVWDMVKVLPQMMRLRSDRSVYGFSARYFKDERLKQAFSFHPLLIGGNPFTATSIYAMIHELEQKFGVWFAMGGTGALVSSLGELFTEIGGEILLNSEVAKIITDSGRAKGLMLTDGSVMKADAVVSNSDIASTYLDLVPGEDRKKYTDRKINGMNYSMSLFVAYFGTDRKYEDIAHHEILMGPRYRELLNDIFNAKTLADDFSLYLHRPTATDPSLAPDGCDCWYVLSPVPHLGGDTDWASEAEFYKHKIYKYLEERYLPDLRKHLVTDLHIDPIYFRNTLNSYLGSAFSVEPTLLQSAWLRPHNRSEDVDDLYFVGAGTHPGAGLPGVMSSGRIVADLIGHA